MQWVEVAVESSTTKCMCESMQDILAAVWFCIEFVGGVLDGHPMFFWLFSLYAWTFSLL
jgi:hypothetical protein